MTPANPNAPLRTGSSPCSADLRAAFPQIKSFSRSNLKYMRAFAEAWPDLAIGQPRLANCCTE
jgi:hypothetical protein